MPGYLDTPVRQVLAISGSATWDSTLSRRSPCRSDACSGRPPYNSAITDLLL